MFNVQFVKMWGGVRARKGVVETRMIVVQSRPSDTTGGLDPQVGFNNFRAPTVG